TVSFQAIIRLCGAGSSLAARPMGPNAPPRAPEPPVCACASDRRWRRRTSWPLTFDPKRACGLDLLIFETGRGMITGAGEPCMNAPLYNGTRCGPERLIRVGV